jgi:hypothetical protein
MGIACPRSAAAKTLDAAGPRPYAAGTISQLPYSLMRFIGAITKGDATMSKYQIAYGKIDGKGTTIGTDSGTGIKNVRRSKAVGGRVDSDERTGVTYFDFGSSFSADPAVVVTAGEDKPPYPRVNQYSSGENRKSSVRVDSYGRGDSWSQRSSYASRDCKFQTLALCASSETKTGLATEANVQVVAGVVKADGTIAHQYGGLTKGPATHVTGAYYCNFASAFTSEPTVVATVENGISKPEEAKVLSVRVTTVTTAQVVLTVHDDQGNLIDLPVHDEEGKSVDAKIHVLAIGPAAQSNVGRFVYGVVARNGGHDNDSNTWAKCDIKVGSGYGAQLKETARYQLKLTDGFQNPPVVVASAEHMKDPHLRQFQVDRIDKNTTYDILRFNAVNGNGSLNNCAFHFIAYASS